MLMALRAISHMKNLIFYWVFILPHTSKDVSNFFVESPILDNRDSVEKWRFGLRSHLYMSSVFERAIRVNVKTEIDPLQSLFILHISNKYLVSEPSVGASYIFNCGLLTMRVFKDGVT